jgi:hypothetical protein
MEILRIERFAARAATQAGFGRKSAVEGRQFVYTPPSERNEIDALVGWTVDR